MQGKLGSEKRMPDIAAGRDKHDLSCEGTAGSR